MPYVNKNQKREGKIWFKRKTRPGMNYEWIGITNLKNLIQKPKETVKNKMKLPHINKLAGNRIFVQTPFSHSTFKNRLKKIYTAKATGFFSQLPVSVSPKSLL